MTAALALATTLSLASQSALGEIAAGDSGNSHQSTWRVADVGIYLDKSLIELSGAGDAIVEAVDMWRSADPRLPHVWPVVGNVDDLGYREGQNNRNTIRYAADGEPRAKGALAVTIVTYDSELFTIYDADIVINGVYKFDDNGKYCGQRGSNGEHNAYDLRDVLAHEFGHWFGLPDDTDDPTAIMYPFFDSGVTRRKSLGDGDRQALDDLYAGDAGNQNKPTACTVARIGGNSDSGVHFWVVFSLIGAMQRVRRGRRTASGDTVNSNTARGPLTPS